MFKNVTISFLLLFSFNVASEEFYELPNEVWSCWGDTPTFSISPNGKYLAIMRSPREDVCDIEQDKIKGVEDEMTYQSLTFMISKLCNQESLVMVLEKKAFTDSSGYLMIDLFTDLV